MFFVSLVRCRFLDLRPRALGEGADSETRSRRSQVQLAPVVFYSWLGLYRSLDTFVAPCTTSGTRVAVAQDSLLSPSKNGLGSALTIDAHAATLLSRPNPDSGLSITDKCVAIPGPYPRRIQRTISINPGARVRVTSSRKIRKGESSGDNLKERGKEKIVVSSPKSILPSLYLSCGSLW